MLWVSAYGTRAEDAEARGLPPGRLHTPPQQFIYPTFPIWLNIPLSKSSAFFKPLSIYET